MRPLCVMPVSAICAQRLLHHAVAILASDTAGSLLLSVQDVIEVTAFGHVRAGMARHGFAESLLREKLGQSGALAEIGAIAPRPATYGALLTVYMACFSPAMLAALADSGLALTAVESLLGLADLHGPVLKLVLSELGAKFMRAQAD